MQQKLVELKKTAEIIKRQAEGLNDNESIWYARGILRVIKTIESLEA